eukprot:scaffold160077_cov79-Cyclotella_meneghiniana.AAC.1
MFRLHRVALPSWCCLPTEDYPPYLDLEEIPIRFGRSDVVQNYITITKTFEADIKASTIKSHTQDRDVACWGVSCAEVCHCGRGGADVGCANEEFEPCHTYFAGISDEAWRGEQNGSKIRGFSGDVLNMDVELSRKLAERKKTEKKVDGGGDIIE